MQPAASTTLPTLGTSWPGFPRLTTNSASNLVSPLCSGGTDPEDASAEGAIVRKLKLGGFGSARLATFRRGQIETRRTPIPSIIFQDVSDTQI